MIFSGLRQAANRAPRTVALAIIAAFAAFMFLPIILLGPQDFTDGDGTLGFDTLMGGLPMQVVLTVVLLLCVAVLGWWRRTLLLTPLDRRGLRPLYITLAYPLFGIGTFMLFLAAEDGPRSPFEILGLVLLLNFFVGLSEELLFRGILFGALRQHNRLVTAIIISSVAFGFLHLVNAGAGQGLQQTAFQIINATALGVLFCALALAANSLWPAVVLHMVWNAYAMMGVAAAEFMGEVPGASVEPPDLSPWSLLLPGLILLIAIAILYGYRHTHGVRLTQVIPGTRDAIPAVEKQVPR